MAPAAGGAPSGLVHQQAAGRRRPCPPFQSRQPRAHGHSLKGRPETGSSETPLFSFPVSPGPPALRHCDMRPVRVPGELPAVKGPHGRAWRLGRHPAAAELPGSHARHASDAGCR